MIKSLLRSWAGRARGKGETLALTLNENVLRYVHASASDERGARLKAWGAEVRGNSTREVFLKRARAMLPSAERVIAVLDSRDYQILQLEAPNVPPAELQSAVRWRAMEFVEGSPQDYTLDVLPIAPQPRQPAKVIAVLAHNDVVRARMLDCKALDQPLSVIEVAETAQRNLLRAVLQAEANPPRVAASLAVDAGRALLIITVEGQLHFFRRFDFDADKFTVLDEMAAGLVGGNANGEAVLRSLTQLHRGLDLWDDINPQLPLGTLRVEAGAATGAIVARLRPETGTETMPLALSAVFEVTASKSQPPWSDAAYLPLLGALLRPVEVQ